MMHDVCDAPELGWSLGEAHVLGSSHRVSQ